MTQHLLQNTTSCSSFYTLSFEKPNTQPPIKNTEPSSIARESDNKNGSNSMSESTHHTLPDRIIAERMRREKISQQFIALSTLIPDLKKLDKVSVLREAIKYVKELKEQVKLMEEERKRKSVESAVFMKKRRVSATETANTNVSLPEVKARVSGKNVLIRILCEKDKAMLSDIFREIQNLHLLVINCSSLSFGSSLLAITIIAKMEDELNVSVQILAQNLKVGLMQLMHTLVIGAVVR